MERPWMGILIDNRQKKFKIPLRKLKLKAGAILNALDCPDGELSIVIVDDAGIKALNSEYLNRNRPTNVLAFPMREGLFPDIRPTLLGDVVISVETADAEALAADMSYADRFDELLVHGILHLFGYDHENDEAQALEMERKTRFLLTQIADI
jgi:probable rRNA maturation factor